MAYQYPKYIETEQRQESPENSQSNADDADDPEQSRRSRKDSNKEYLMNLKKDLKLEEIREKKTMRILKKLQGPKAEGGDINHSSSLGRSGKANTSSQSYGGVVNMYQYMNTAGMMMQKSKKEKEVLQGGKPAGASRVGSGIAAITAVKRRK